MWQKFLFTLYSKLIVIMIKFSSKISFYTGFSALLALCFGPFGGSDYDIDVGFSVKNATTNDLIQELRM